MSEERTFIGIKPDAIKRGLIGEMIKRMEETGLKIVAMKMIQLTDEKLDEHYSHHKEKPFFEELKNFMKSTPIIAMIVEGTYAIENVRKILGATDGTEEGTIRNEYSPNEIQQNLVHASDSKEAAKIEIERFFKKEEIHDYALHEDDLVHLWPRFGKKEK